MSVSANADAPRSTDSPLAGVNGEVELAEDVFWPEENADGLVTTSASPDDDLQTILESVSVPVIDVVRTETYPSESGGYANVWRGNRKSDGLEVALKGLHVGSRDSVLLKRIVREISIWSTLDHVNVLPFLGLALQEGSKLPYLVSPWSIHGNVMVYLSSHPLANRRDLVRGIRDGISYLHDKGIVHGDIKGANILVDQNDRPQLADFGLSVIKEDDIHVQTTTSTFAGSARWMAPERLSPERFGLTARSSRSPASDVFAFGMTIYQIFSGFYPFYDQTSMAASVAIVNDIRPPHPGKSATDRGLTTALWGFVRLCWDQTPSSRPELSALDAALDAIEDKQTDSDTLMIRVYEPCPCCVENSLGYQCPYPVPDFKKGTSAHRADFEISKIPRGHTLCVNCRRLIPVLPQPTANSCSLCTAAVCTPFYNRCSGTTRSYEDTITIKSLCEHFSTREPAAEQIELLSPYLFFQNRYERNRLRNYLFEKDLSFRDLLDAVLELHTNHALPRTKWQGPGIAGDQQTFAAEDRTCQNCAFDLMEGNLLTWWTVQRETDDNLKLLVAAMSKCPDGANCRQAPVDFHHCAKFDHFFRPKQSVASPHPSPPPEGIRSHGNRRDTVSQFRALFSPDNVTFRDRDGQPSFMTTIHIREGIDPPGKATLWDWVFEKSVRRSTEPAFELYYTRDGSEFSRTGNVKFTLLEETDDMIWVRTRDGEIPEGLRPVIGGTDVDGTTLYHAAVWWRTRRIPGKVSTELGRAYVGYGGDEIAVLEGYDLLCWK